MLIENSNPYLMRIRRPSKDRIVKLKLKLKDLNFQANNNIITSVI